MTRLAIGSPVDVPPAGTGTARTTALAGAVPFVSEVLVLTVDTAALATAATVTGGVGWATGWYLLGALLLLAGTGRHRPRITLRLGDELPGLLGCVLLPAPLLVGTAGLAAVPAAVVGLTAGRLASYHVLRNARRRGLLAEPAVLVGAGALGYQVARILAGHPEFGLVGYGFVDDQPPRGEPPRGQPPLPWLGRLAALPHLVAVHRIRRVIVCSGVPSDEALVPALRALGGAAVDVYVVPRLHELGHAGSLAVRDEVWGVPLTPLRRAGVARPVLKRVFDVVVAGSLLVVLVPVLAVLALAVRVTEGSPVLFRQVRLTRTGHVARILKFRSLAPDPAGEPATDTQWAVPADRCGRLGRLLRRTHTDELPQLVNVLRGELSLVGPRPERPYFTGLFTDEIPGYAERHRMPAGITGWAQVHGLHGDTSIADRARFDNRYIDDWSLWRDVVIAARTPLTMFSRRDR